MRKAWKNSLKIQLVDNYPCAIVAFDISTITVSDPLSNCAFFNPCPDLDVAD